MWFCCSQFRFVLHVGTAESRTFCHLNECRIITVACHPYTGDILAPTWNWKLLKDQGGSTKPYSLCVTKLWLVLRRTDDGKWVAGSFFYDTWCNLPTSKLVQTLFSQQEADWRVVVSATTLAIQLDFSWWSSKWVIFPLLLHQTQSYITFLFKNRTLKAFLNCYSYVWYYFKWPDCWN